jgi:hypothetical protein
MILAIKSLVRKSQKAISRKFDRFIDRHLRLKIFFHDSSLYPISHLRKRRLHTAVMRSSPFPPRVHIEISSLCNAHCVGCWHENIKRRQGIIDQHLYQQIIEECVFYKSDLMLSWVGEPTLDPGLVQKITSAKSSGIRWVGLATNGMTMDERLSREIIEARLDTITFSVDGATKDTFEAVRRGTSFQTVTQNIERFISLRNRMGKDKPHININFRKMQSNRHEWELLKRSWRNRVNSISCWILSEGQKEHYPFTPQERLYKRRLPCFWLWQSLPIYISGKVGLCCCFAKEELLTGDCTTQSIREVWNGEVFARYRNAHRQLQFHALPVCRNCNLWMFPVWGCPPTAHPWYY